jgi:sigma-B regulation protein RsbU (phosphoserine phosphatase)
MLETANDLLCAQNPTLMFSTLFFAILDLETGEVEYANCGHNPPLIVRRNGASQPLGSGGAPLGLVPGRAIASARFRLDPGETLFLFTDGVTESVDLRGETYGETRLAETLATTRGDFAANIVDAVMADVERFVGGAEPFDDVTCLALVRL